MSTEKYNGKQPPNQTQPHKQIAEVNKVWHSRPAEPAYTNKCVTNHCKTKKPDITKRNYTSIDLTAPNGVSQGICLDCYNTLKEIYEPQGHIFVVANLSEGDSK